MHVFWTQNLLRLTLMVQLELKGLTEYFFQWSWGSVVGMSIRYGLEDWGFVVRVPVWSRIHPMGTGTLSLGVKRPGRETDNSPPASAEIKKMKIYTSLPYTLSWRSAKLVKHTFLPLYFLQWNLIIVLDALSICVGCNVHSLNLQVLSTVEYHRLLKGLRWSLTIKNAKKWQNEQCSVSQQGWAHVAF
jgi:hypothetical protein